MKNVLHVHRDQSVREDLVISLFNRYDNETGIQLNLLHKIEDLDFVDNMVLLSQKVAHIRQKFQALQEKAARGSR